MEKLLFVSVFLFSASVLAENKYDQEMLKSLGYDTSAAELLEAGAHFLPGDHPVSIIVNGQSKGAHVITFDQSGSPCWSAELLRTLGIDAAGFDKIPPACLKPTASSEIRIIEQVGQNSLELQVPADSLLNDIQYATGGKALVVNYDGRRYEYLTRSGANHSSQTLTTEIGANINQWIFRSGQSYTSLDNRNTFTRLYSYGQRSVPGWASVLQIGEITSNDPLFSGITLTGAQMVPEHALQNGGANRVALDVLMPQAGTAEVWQGNVLLKTFQVSTGMNKLDGIPALNQQDDFVVISHDETGNRQQRIIPYIQARSDIALMETGTSLALGQLRLTQEEYPVLLGSTGVYQSSQLGLVAGGLVSEAYQAASWGGSIRFTERLLATVSQTYSLAHNTTDTEGNNTGKKQGLSHQFGLNYPVNRYLSLTSSANFRSRNYMDTGGAWSSHKTAGETGQIKAQYAVGVNYNQPWLGVFSFTGSQSQTWQGPDTTGYALGWGRTFGDVNVNLGIQKNRITDDRQHHDNRYVYLNVSIPFGNNRNLRSWVSDNGQQTRAGIGYDQTVNDKFAWSLSSEKGQHEDPSVASSATWTNKYSQLSGGASRNGGSTSYNAGMRGGAVLHSEGLTFTPRKVGDTFGIISLNNTLPDVEIRTPAGKVWSDRSGHAISSWTPWQKNTVQIDNQTLPKNVQVSGGIADVTPYRGSVVPVMLPAISVRRALVTFPPGEGPAPASAVKDAKGTLLAFVNEDGTLFFDDLPEGVLFGQLRNGASCTIELTSPWKDEPGTLYASLSARCVP